MKYLMVILFLCLTGCAAPAVYTNTLSMKPPPRPELPLITAEQLSCLSDEAYKALVERDRLRLEYAEKLEVIIKPLQGKQ